MATPLTWRVLTLTALAMTAFAANSLLNRWALDSGSIGPAAFAFIRIFSGALVLAILILSRLSPEPWTARFSIWASGGSWAGAASLYFYAGAFSFAYLALETGTGALLLFASVQLTMIGVTLLHGGRMNATETLGAVIAGASLIYLLSPGADAPPIGAAALMIVAGIAWGAYSLLGTRSGQDAAATTAGNFLRAIPLAVPVVLLFPHAHGISLTGLTLALVSGAITSGLGYAIWYQAAPDLGPIRAAVVQLTVPVIAALMGAAVLMEVPGPRLLIAGALILGGVGLTLYGRNAPNLSKP